MSNLFDSLFKSEERYKEAVYNSLDRKRNEARNNVAQKDAYVQSDSFEEQDSFIAYRDRAEVWQKLHGEESLIQRVYSRPYFAHIELKESGAGRQSGDC